MLSHTALLLLLSELAYGALSVFLLWDEALAYRLNSIAPGFRIGPQARYKNGPATSLAPYFLGAGVGFEGVACALRVYRNRRCAARLMARAGAPPEIQEPLRQLAGYTWAAELLMHVIGVRVARWGPVRRLGARLSRQLAREAAQLGTQAPWLAAAVLLLPPVMMALPAALFGRKVAGVTAGLLYTHILEPGAGSLRWERDAWDASDASPLLLYRFMFGWA